MTRRILILGGGGMLARELGPALATRGWTVDLAPRSACDVRDAVAVASRVAGAEVVVNCAAWTAVDRAELDPTPVREVNVTGADHVAHAAARAGATLVHLSTNSVFDGLSTRPYEETDPPCPRGVYAQSKLDGEIAVAASGVRAYVIRTGNLYGAGGANFFDAIFSRARSGVAFDVVTTQRLAPTWTRELAHQLVRLLEEAPPGLYHATADGATTPYEAALHALERMGLPGSLARPVEALGEAWPAPRPPNGLLSHARLERLGLYSMRDWREALDAWLDERRSPADPTRVKEMSS